MQIDPILAKVGHPISELFLRQLGLDFLRNDVLDVNDIRPTGKQLRMGTLAGKLELLQAVARAVSSHQHLMAEAPRKTFSRLNRRLKSKALDQPGSV